MINRASIGLCLAGIFASPCAVGAEGSAPMKQHEELSAGMRQAPIELEDLHSLLRMARERNRPYLPPSADALQRTTAAGLMLFTDARNGQCQRALPDLAQAGFEVARTSLGGAPAFVVREVFTQRKGGGVYIIRQGTVRRERLVQVPHSFFDMGTLEIGIALANAAQARALFVNTVHRYQGGKPPAPDDEDRESAPADLAHQDATFFQRLTRSALTTLPQLQVIQVHGFGDGTVPGCAQAAVVVSPGAATAGMPEAARVTARLQALFGRERVLLYPRDTRKFGAQTNVQGQAVAQIRGATFLHLELSRALRLRMQSDNALRRAFVAAVVGGRDEQP
jgi:hypothetical protein